MAENLVHHWVELTDVTMGKCMVVSMVEPSEILRVVVMVYQMVYSKVDWMGEFEVAKMEWMMESLMGVLMV